MAASSSKRSAEGAKQKRTQAEVPAKKLAVKKEQQSKGKGKAKAQDQGGNEKRAQGTAAAVNAAQDTGTTREASAAWGWHTITDSAVSVVPPVFTKDGSYFFSVVGSSVKIHSTATGQIVSTLSLPPSATPSTITCAILNPHNIFQLLTGSQNGQIVVWDFLEGVILRTLDVGQPIRHICAHKKFDDCVFVAVSKSTPKKKQAVPDDGAAILKVSLQPSAETSEQKGQKPSAITAVGKTKAAVGLAFSPSGAWLVAAGEYKAYVVSTDSLDTGFTKFLSPERLTCLAFHPQEDYFATGDEKGQIRIWYCLNEDMPGIGQATGVGKKAQTSTLHWHAHAVSSLMFTANGAYLLSGGEEAVLVIWQVHTGRKEFVPRVGAPISTIALSRSEDREEYLLGLSDSTYMFIDPVTLKPSRSYSRVKIDPTHQVSSTAPAPLAHHALASTLILPSSHASSLQIYSPSSSKLISELEVVPASRVSRRDEQLLEPPHVESTVVSSSGEWMATLDRRAADGAFRAEVHLKFWWWDTKSESWTLNTRIDNPHGSESLSAIIFCPSVPGRPQQLVTTAKDGNIKTWRVRTIKNKGGESEDFWILRSTISFRNEVPQSAALSPCGTLLAVVLTTHVALYDAYTNIELDSLSFPECQKLISVTFVGKGRNIVIAGARDLILWDLIMQSITWHHHTTHKVDRIIPHPSGDTFAVFFASHPTTRVSVFRLHSSSPSKSHVLPFSLRSVLWYPGDQLQKNAFSLIGITHDWSVVTIGENVRPKEEEGASAHGISSTSTTANKSSLFNNIFGALSWAEPESSESAPRPHIQPWRGKEGAAIFDSPAYLLPPLGSLYSPFMEGFLRVRPEPTELQSGDGAGAKMDEDDDVQMADARDDAPPGAPVGRSVDREEMDALVNLFKESTTSASAPNTAKPQINGRLNGIHTHSPSLATPKQNGISKKPRAQPTSPMTGHPPISPSSSVTSEIHVPVVSGNTKKRKKIF